MKKAVFLLLLIACAYDQYAARYVIDGDTFVLNNGDTIRLAGIDAPEKGDVNYDWAGYELQRRLVGRELTFEGDSYDRYGRLVRFVFANGENVNVELVRAGWARAFMHKGTPYESLLEKAQTEARAEMKGMWHVDDFAYQRLGNQCVELGCQLGTIAVASKYGEVFYNCGCPDALRIGKENMDCFVSVQDAIAEGLREAKRC